MIREDYDCDDFTNGEYSSSTSDFLNEENDICIHCLPQYAILQKSSYLMIFKKSEFYFELYYWNNESFQKSSKTCTYKDLINESNVQFCSYMELRTFLKGENKLVQWENIINE